MLLRRDWHLTGFSLFSLLLDQAVFYLAFLGAYAVKFQDYRVDTLGPENSYCLLPLALDTQYSRFFLLAWTLYALSLVAAGTYRGAFSTSGTYQWATAAKGAVLATVLLMAVIFLMKGSYYSRGFVLLFLGFQVALLPLSKGVGRQVRNLLVRKGVGRLRTVVAGWPEQAAALLERIRQELFVNYNILGVLIPEGANQVLSGERILEQSSWESVLKTMLPHQVLVPEGGPALPFLPRLITLGQELGIEVKAIPTTATTVKVGETRVHELLGLPLGKSGPCRQRGWRLAVKTALDRGIAFVLLGLISPLFLVLILAVKLTSRGPVFYRQERVGRGGRTFTLYKFRSMVHDADSRLPDIAASNEMTSPLFKLREDPRITPLGRFLRRYSLDELPQLWNVLCGDLSLVGPRPPLPKEVARFEPWQLGRLDVMQGMTGLWQVSGRSQVDFEEMMLLDLYYRENWALLLDLEILLDTLPAIISGKGAF